MVRPLYIGSRLLLVLAVVPAATARAQGLADLFAPKRNERRTEAMVAMRDGVRLATDVILPEGKGPWPVILTRTPYGRRQGSISGIEPNFIARGYARVVQDCRGRFQSEGKFGVFDKEPLDGYDTVEWIAKQPWCNGKVGMYGVSASGILANFAAIGAPPHLVCNFVAVAHGCDYRFGSYPGGCFLLDMNERWYRTLGQPLAEGPKPRVQVYDADFAVRDLSKHYAKVTVPTFNLGGWYDIFSESTVENFEGLDKHGGGLAAGNQRLLMGAFGHLPLQGKLRYPADASFPDFSQCTEWFDRWMKEKPNAEEKRARARYFLMGDPFDKSAPGNEWRLSESWPPESRERYLYLCEGGRLRSAPPEEDGVDSYRHDPRDPVPTVGGNNLFLARGPMDQRELRERKDILRYQTEPLESPLEVVGRVYAELFVSTDVQDTDFMVKLIDVYPDGYEALVLDQPLRLRFRNGFDAPAKAEKNKVYPIRINLWTTALVFHRGHRIAVHVQSSNAPRFEPHTNTWEPVADYDRAVIATNAVHRGPGSPSRIILPVVRDESAGAAADSRKSLPANAVGTRVQ